MDTDNFIETEDIYVYHTNDVKTRFDTGIYELERPLLKSKKENKVIGLVKDALGGKIRCPIKIKKYNYLIDDNDENMKTKGAKKVFHKMKT